MLPISTTSLGPDTLAGTFQAGETLTGGGTNFTAIYRGGDQTELQVEYTELGTGATTATFSRTTGLADGMFVTLGDTDEAGAEVITIAAGGINELNNEITFTRSTFGTTARTIPGGLACNAWSASATTSTISEGGICCSG